MGPVDVARVCHEANRALCIALGDFSQPRWEEAPGWQTDSALNGVRNLLDHPEAGAEASHESWFREKVETGWSYGPTKDPETKRHPCMVPFSHLPQEQQAKDHLFHAIVRALQPIVVREE